MTKVKLLALSTAFFLSAAGSAQQQPALAPLSYADHADLALGAEIVADVRVAEAIRLRGPAAVSVPPGHSRFFVRADVAALIKGPAGFPAQISYLVDLPNAADGDPPRLRRRAAFTIFADAVPGRPGEVQLIAPDAQQPASEAGLAEIRAIIAEAARANAAPRIARVSGAFHVPGTLAGESETQIFLQTPESRPVSLTILRRPGETPQWAVALGEIVDQAAEAPRAKSLLWYQLACGLPRALPVAALRDADPAAAAAIRADYGFVLQQLGACGRTRRPA